MRIELFRRRLGRLLLLCGIVVLSSYVIAGYLRFGAQRVPAPALNPPAQAGPPQWQQLTTVANDYLNKNKVEQALVNYREALALNPRYVDAQLGLAAGEYRAGRQAIALEEYKRTLKLSPKNTNAMISLARIEATESGAWPQAEAHYREYLTLRPDDLEASRELARVLSWEGKAEQAVGMFQRPGVAPLMTASDRRDYAFALARAGRNTEAEAEIRGLLAGSPGDRELSLELADLYAARKDWSGALPLYRSLLAKSPADPKLNLQYGWALLAAKNYAEAVGPLERARDAMPSNGEAGLALARAVKGSGDLKRACKEYERALPAFQGNAAVVREYADALLEKRDYKKAARFYGSAYQQGLRDDRLLAGYAGALSGAGKYKEALPVLEELQRRRPTPRETFELAKLMHRLGRDDQARALLRQVETSQ
ncbi:MAG: tetratricopeptide repeat protein [Acidobacteria bacterium]|nr:tetratricopeptide repeat protein [Acidobacteriota bacterium]